LTNIDFHVEYQNDVNASWRESNKNKLFLSIIIDSFLDFFPSLNYSKQFNCAFFVHILNILLGYCFFKQRTFHKLSRVKCYHFHRYPWKADKAALIVLTINCTVWCTWCTEVAAVVATFHACSVQMSNDRKRTREGEKETAKVMHTWYIMCRSTCVFQLCQWVRPVQTNRCYSLTFVRTRVSIQAVHRV